MKVSKWVSNWWFELDWNDDLTEEEKQVLREKIIRSCKKTKVNASRKLAEINAHLENVHWSIYESKWFKEQGALQSLIDYCEDQIQRALGNKPSLMEELLQECN